MPTLDEKIAKARIELLKLRETSIIEGDANQKKIDELKAKKAMLDKKQKELLDQGLDLSEYAAVMKKANENDKGPFNSIAFGHQVLLLNTVHLMECREMAVRTSARQGKQLVKFVERRKRALLEQNANHDLLFANQLGLHYEKMKELEEEYRRIIAAQQKAFWKIQSTSFPMIEFNPPTLSATTSEFIDGQRRFFGKNGSCKPLAEIENRTAKREASMRNLMSLEGIGMTHDMYGADSGRLTDSSGSFPTHIEFTMSLTSDDGDLKGTSKKGRRLKRSDSVDTLSTAGEELLSTIQGYFFGGGNKNDRDRSKSEGLKMDESDRDWASAHGNHQRRRASTTNNSAALIV